MGAAETSYVYVRAQSDRARRRLPRAAVACFEHMPKARGVYPRRYVYRIPIDAFAENLCGGSYSEGRISRARVVEANVRECLPSLRYSMAVNDGL